MGAQRRAKRIGERRAPVRLGVSAPCPETPCLGPQGAPTFARAPHAAVAGPGAPYAGGARNPSRTPTGVNGGFSLVKAESGVPTSAGAPGIITARNNSALGRGVPYARPVPLHARDRLEVKDHQLTGTGGRNDAHEHDGLPGELAWVLGKCFPVETTGLSGLPTPPTSAIEFVCT